MTDEIERGAVTYIEKIDELGGAPKAIDFMQKEIKDSAYRYQIDIEHGKKTVIGVNKFTMETERPKGLLRVNPTVQEHQVQKLKKLRMERDNEGVEKILADLKKAAESNENLMPYLIQAVKKYATLGEICDVLRGVFGEYRQQIVF